MPFLNRSGIKIHYEIFGRGTPFIFLHGLGGDLSQPIEHFKAKDGIKLVLIELRGNGETPLGNAKDLSFDCMAEDVKAVCDHLNFESFYIGGISMGAAVSMNFALKYQRFIKGLILIRIAWLDGPMKKNICALYKRVAEYINIPGGREIFRECDEYKRLLKEAPATAVSFAGYFDNPVSKKTYEKFEILPESRPIDSLDLLKKIEIPTLIIATKMDPLHPYEYGTICTEKIPHSGFFEAVSKSVDREYHTEQVKNEIDRFICSVEKTDEIQ